MAKRKLIDPVEFFEGEQPDFIPVDEWVPTPEDEIFKTVKGAIMLPVSDFYGVEPCPSLDAFILKNKRSYNNPKLRAHLIQYLNYFEKFYDQDHELLFIYYRLKYLIDYEAGYTKEALFYDLEKYIMRGTVSLKISYMNNDNYDLHLTYRNKKNPVLQYSDVHAKMLMKISILMNAIIPLLCHFMYSRSILNSQDFLLEAYDMLMHLFPGVDLYSKLYETAMSNVNRSAKKDSALWAVQDIRGINTTTHALGCVVNILLNIIPKYLYNQNLVHFNFKSVQANTGLTKWFGIIAIL